MSYVVVATYRLKPGEADRVQDALQAMLGPTQQEQGCRVYRVHRSVEDQLLFFLYEEYDDEAAFKAHLASDHFARHIKGEVWPRLEERVRMIGSPIGPDDGR